MKGMPVMPDAGKLIDAIELRLAALDINSRQAAQIATQQLKEISARSGDTAANYHGCSERAADVDRTLSWHVTMAKRMFVQLGCHDRQRLPRSSEADAAAADA
jgi:hypothetical protein